METRATTTSRLEEHLSLLLSKMDQQGEQLQQLSQLQSERVDSVVHRLDETDKHIEAVAGDLDSVKGMVHGRLDEVESSFTNLKAVQEELGEKQKVLKAELRDELLHELTAEMKSTLRPTAPPFIPAATDSPGDGKDGDTLSVRAGHGSDGTGRDAAKTTPGSGESGAGGAATVSTMMEGGSTVTHGGGSAATIATPSSVQKPAPFDGKLTWDAYHTQFEMLAKINRWNDVDKAVYLAISLRGPAATVLTNLPPDQRQNYASLTAALQSRFCTAHQTELNRVRLKARARRREETLPELAEDIERLVRLAYPDAAESMVDVLAKDQFMDALPEEDMRLRIRQHRPATLRAALETALELESYQLASKQKARFVREIQLEKEQPVQSVSTSKGSVAPGDVLQQLVVALEQCCKDFRAPTSSNARRERMQTSRSNLVCWKCKLSGHRRAECPQLRATQQQSESEVSQPGNEN